MCEVKYSMSISEVMEIVKAALVSRYSIKDMVNSEEEYESSMAALSVFGDMCTWVYGNSDIGMLKFYNCDDERELNEVKLEEFIGCLESYLDKLDIDIIEE